MTEEQSSSADVYSQLQRIVTAIHSDTVHFVDEMTFI